MELKNKKVTKTGNGYYLRVPTKYVKDGLVDITKRYDVTLKEGGQHEQEHKPA